MDYEEVRPRGWTPKEIPTIWVDYTTGQGVTREGTSVRPKIGGTRKNPNLTDMLDTAASYGAERIMFTGKVPPGEPGGRHWLLVGTPNWTGRDVWTDSDAPAGRFKHVSTGQEVNVRAVKEWFGDIPLTPAQARLAWNALDTVVRGIDDRARLMLSPARTGANLWAWSLPKSTPLVPVTPDIAEELHYTSGQHHYGHFVTGKNFDAHEDCVPLIDAEKTKKISAFAHVDGKFMYAALGRELGVGPGIRHNRTSAYELMTTQPYARVRYEIKFTVPDNWNHLGILPVKHDNVNDGWYYPNRPGATGITWADAAEVSVALNAGWLIEPLSAVEFYKARPVDTWMERLNRARDRVVDNPEMAAPLKRAITAALRNMLIQGVGRFASRGRDRQVTVASAFDIPAEYVATSKRYGELYTYKEPGTGARNDGFYHPEIAAQVWGRGRARILSAPTATDRAGGGALTVPPHTLIGVNGDALYTTELPAWSKPVERGGGDDGKTGRLRLKSFIRGSFMTPTSIEARDALRARADKAGPAAAWAEDGASA
jgi:hypothetical protein